MTYHIVYQTTNKVNGKIYVGYHRTENLNDTYLGSGVILAKAIKKYGLDNFERATLFTYEDESLARAKEAEIVNPEFLKRKDVYNLNVGGFGSNYYNMISGKIHTPEANAKRSATVKALWNGNDARRSKTSQRMQRNNPMYDPVAYASMVAKNTANPSQLGKLGIEHPTFELVTAFDLATKQTLKVTIAQFQAADYLISPSQKLVMVVAGETFYNLRKGIERLWQEYNLAGDVDYLFFQNNKVNIIQNNKIIKKGHMKAFAPKTWNELGIYALPLDRDQAI